MFSLLFLRVVLLVLPVAAQLSSSAPASQASQVAPSASSAPADAPPPPVPGSPAGEVAKPVIHHIHLTADARQNDSVFQLGSIITLEVGGLSPWLRYQEGLLVQRGVPAQQAHTQARNLVLYIDDAPLIGMPPLAVYADEAPAAGQAAGRRDDKVVFKLSRTIDNARYWNVVYSSPWAFSHPGHIGLGYDDQVITELYPGPTGIVRFELIQPSALWGSLLGTAVLGLSILLLASRSWLLRETDGQATGPDGAIVTVANPAYSLAKMQLAWWTFIILSCYLIIYCVTGEMPDLSVTSLGLLGISAGTTALNGLLTPAAGAQPLPVYPSRGWLTDILSDGHGVSMHRLQKVVISLMMGYFFVRSVYKTVAMPDWTTNQMLLLAVSSATYLGLKWQENRQPDAAAAPNTIPPSASPSLPAFPQNPSSGSSSDAVFNPQVTGAGGALPGASVSVAQA
ncbi:hypothetical protein SAMN02745146_2766 [Hymenobacter daecheongensis DSM 21074]|uniref:Uncharacterized protein n=1 Tax=Hymenobacter daecheongensis DSM 21074 TaxID=1121955 RepID=A0A1M6I2R8_9BACT|nr:hypothetical protein [Hymenobacter daecheongensis]SHJ28742.1 hypothetical protein SAMN02745146_2766 [Hymenobacter daecheongensis DSM 21074]